jgi:hypothetical protein
MFPSHRAFGCLRGLSSSLFPHTKADVRQLLEGIGAMLRADSEAAHAIFQEIVTTPTHREADDDAVVHEDEPENGENDDQIVGGMSSLSAIEKASQFLCRQIEGA